MIVISCFRFSNTHVYSCSIDGSQKLDNIKMVIRIGIMTFIHFGMSYSDVMPLNLFVGTEKYHDNP
jgi:hypothetical protein